MEKLFIKQLKQLGLVGIIPSIKHFGIANDKTSWKNLLAGKENWPNECIKEDTIHILRKKATNKIVLTSRQEDVFKLICHRGLSNKKIAQTLNISESTVKVHMSAILKAYGVRNRTQLALAGGSGLTA
jgi:DNA-binding NarL/FixJ family response regulator